MTLKERISTDIKEAMRAQNKAKLGALRLISAAIKQIEVDERIEMDDTRILAVLDKMVKQRKESVHQYESAGRQDLVDVENFELEIIRQYLPAPLSAEEIKTLIIEAIQATNAEKMADMGKVMAHLKAKIQGRADMSTVSALIKERLA